MLKNTRFFRAKHVNNLENFIQNLLTSTSGNSAAPQSQFNGSTPSGINSLGGLGGSLGGILGSILGGQSNTPFGAHAGQSSHTGLGSILGGLLNGSTSRQSVPAPSQANIPHSAPSKQSQLLVLLVPLILMWIQKKGGLHQALESLTRAGMGQQVQSWVSNQANQSIQPQQVTDILPQAQAEQIAQQTNTNTSQVYDTVANLLPQLVNAITPNGQQHGNGSTSQIQQVLNAFRAMT